MHLCSVLSNQEIALGYYRLTLAVPGEFSSPLPGQFVQVRCGDATDPLLPRPFSICTFADSLPDHSPLALRHSSLATRHSALWKELSIVYQVIGKGTLILSTKQIGDAVSVLGPLGNSFPIHENTKSVLIGGGVGVPPMVMLADWLIRKEGRCAADIVVLQGARTKTAILCEDLFRSLGVTLHLATDDGTLGDHGTVVALLQTYHLSQSTASPVTLYACGPHAMLKAVAEFATERNLLCYVSMEAPMPCGYGVCMGCVVPTTNGYKRCCLDGPVFESRHVIWQ